MPNVLIFSVFLPEIDDSRVLSVIRAGAEEMGGLMETPPPHWLKDAGASACNVAYHNTYEALHNTE